MFQPFWGVFRSRMYYTRQLQHPLEEREVAKSFTVKDSDFKTSRWTGGIIARCVAVAIKPEGVAVRNSLDSSKNTVFFTREEWDAFIKGVKDGDFDL